MKLPHAHPDDLKWLRGWLRSNLTVASFATLLLIFVQHSPNIPIVPGHAATRSDSLRAPIAAARDDDRPGSTDLPPETELVLLASRRPNPVAPHGWRRTVDGWEHVSTWTPTFTSTGVTINQLIIAQQDQEPAWIRLIFAKIRGIPPLMIALLQIVAVAAIIHVARSRRTR